MPRLRTRSVPKRCRLRKSSRTRLEQRRDRRVCGGASITSGREMSWRATLKSHRSRTQWCVLRHGPAPAPSDVPSDARGLLDMRRCSTPGLVRTAHAPPPRTREWALGVAADSTHQDSRSTRRAPSQFMRKVQQLMQNERVVEVFSIFDVDGSGAISSKELRPLVQMAVRNPSPELVDDMVASLDINKDGEVDLWEFCVAMQKRAQVCCPTHPPSHPPPHPPAFPPKPAVSPARARLPSPSPLPHAPLAPPSYRCLRVHAMVAVT